MTILQSSTDLHCPESSLSFSTADQVTSLQFGIFTPSSAGRCRWCTCPTEFWSIGHSGVNRGEPAAANFAARHCYSLFKQLSVIGAQSSETKAEGQIGLALEQGESASRRSRAHRPGASIIPYRAGSQNGRPGRPSTGSGACRKAGQGGCSCKPSTLALQRVDSFAVGWRRTPALPRGYGALGSEVLEQPLFDSGPGSGYSHVSQRHDMRNAGLLLQEYLKSSTDPYLKHASVEVEDGPAEGRMRVAVSFRVQYWLQSGT